VVGRLPSGTHGSSEIALAAHFLAPLRKTWHLLLGFSQLPGIIWDVPAIPTFCGVLVAQCELPRLAQPSCYTACPQLCARCAISFYLTVASDLPSSHPRQALRIKQTCFTTLIADRDWAPVMPLPQLLNSERIECYGPGGLHPVDIGNTFRLGRYKVVRKLGHGSNSTVWLARDTRYHDLRAWVRIPLITECIVVLGMWRSNS